MKNTTCSISFTVTDHHINLLREMNWQWNDSYGDGGPAVDSKRPYGNSNAARDVAEIVGIPEGDYDEEDMLVLHRETFLALRIFLDIGEMKRGRYVYDGTHWELKAIGEVEHDHDF